MPEERCRFTVRLSAEADRMMKKVMMIEQVYNICFLGPSCVEKTHQELALAV